MAYGVNGVDFTLQPTAGRWLPETPVGYTGDGHPIYAAVRSFQLTWGLMSIAEFNDVLLDYNTTRITGTATVSLPDFDAASWSFRNYSGCTLQKPEVGQYFTEHVTDVNMLVLNIMP